MFRTFLRLYGCRAVLFALACHVAEEAQKIGSFWFAVEFETAGAAADGIDAPPEAGRCAAAHHFRRVILFPWFRQAQFFNGGVKPGHVEIARHGCLGQRLGGHEPGVVEIERSRMFPEAIELGNDGKRIFASHPVCTGHQHAGIGAVSPYTAFDDEANGRR